MSNRETFVLYTLRLDSLCLKRSDGVELDFTDTLKNGRFNYGIFEDLVRRLTGFTKTTGSDHKDEFGNRYEQKAFADLDQYPTEPDTFQTSASSTFGANNKGPIIKAHLENGEYEDALAICKATGYDKNDFYIYTNTSNFVTSVPFRFIIIPTEVVLKNLSPQDPRKISRSAVVSLATRTEVIG